MASPEGDATTRVRDHSSGRPGSLIPLNSPEPVVFKGDGAEGRVLLLHRGGEDWPYAEHFANKKRRWELRLEIRFCGNEPPMECPMLGLEVERPVRTSWMVSCALSFAKAINRAKGDPFTVLLGESGAGGEDGSTGGRQGHILFPAWTVDTIVETPEGKTPPALTSCALSPSPREQRKAIRWGRAGVTYTCIYYSAYIDLLSWELKNLPMDGLDITKLAGDQTLHLVVCDLPGAQPRRYFLDLALERVSLDDSDSPSGGKAAGSPAAEPEPSVCWQSCIDDMSVCSDFEESGDECDALEPTDQAVGVRLAAEGPLPGDIVGSYIHRSSGRRESTLVLQRDGSFWHSHFVRPRGSEKSRQCLPLGGLRICGSGRSDAARQAAASQAWDQLEVLGSYTVSALGGVVLNCEAWKATAGGPDGLRRVDHALWALQEHRAVLDAMIAEQRIRVHYLPGMLGPQSGAPEDVGDDRGERVITELMLFEETADPDMAATLDDPATTAMFACLGFCRTYGRRGLCGTQGGRPA